MRKAERLFQLVNLIRVHQPITAERLAERLDVSVRSIYRYIDDLSVGGIPVYGEPGRGYALRERFELPPLTLTRDELDALLLGVDMLTQGSGNRLGTAARSLLDKIQAAVPEHRPGPHAFQAPSRTVHPDHLTHWDPIHQAIQGRTPIRIHYLSLDDQTSQRTVLPLGLFYWGNKWTLGTWCLLRQDYRDFRLDRIQSIEPTPEHSAIPDTVDLNHYLSRIRQKNTQAH